MLPFVACKETAPPTPPVVLLGPELPEVGPELEPEALITEAAARLIFPTLDVKLTAPPSLPEFEPVAVPPAVLMLPVRTTSPVVAVAVKLPPTALAEPVPTIAPVMLSAVALTFNAVANVLLPKFKAVESTNVTLLPLVTLMLENSFEVLLKVMSLPDPAANVAAPVTFIALVCVSAPPVVTPKVPATDPTFNARAFASCSCKLLTLAIPTVLKLLPELFKVILLLAPAESVASPPTETAPD